MKKVLCLLMAAVMCLGLTGCASEKKVDVTGEWYELWWLYPYEDELAGLVEQSDLPGRFQKAGYSFRDVNDTTTVIDQDWESYHHFMAAHREDSGAWVLWRSPTSGYGVLSFAGGKGLSWEVGYEDETESFTYTLTDDVLSMTISNRTFVYTLERWDDDLICMKNNDGSTSAVSLLVRRNTILRDEEVGIR